MIEIVFGESACGSLKIAQTYGKGKYRGSAVSIFMRHYSNISIQKMYGRKNP